MRVAVLAGLVLGLGGAAPAGPAAAAEAVHPTATPFATLTRRAWTMDDGLPQSAALSIAQTPDGYLWVGTQEGLARFDGVRFRIYDRATVAGWRSHAIQALHVTRDGCLWVSTDEGRLLRREGDRFTPVSLPPRMSTVKVIQEARGGGLWLGGVGGVTRLQPATSPPGFTDLLVQDEVFALREREDGSVWVGTEAGLHVCRSQGCIRIGEESGLPSGAVTALLDDGDGMWVGTRRAGLFRLADGQARSAGGTREHVMAILRDHEGTLWLATEHGLKSLRAGRFESFLGDGLSGRASCLFLDREGSLWVGTVFDGLIRLGTGKARTYGQRADLTYPPVSTVYEDRHGDVWLGTVGAGLGRLSADGLRFYTQQHGLADDAVGPIVEDREGTLWFGVRVNGTLHRFRDGHLSSVDLGPFSPRALYEDARGALWIGTRGGGLFRRRGGDLRRWTTKQGLPSDTVRAIVADGGDGLWLATLEGLVHFREHVLEVYTAADGLPSKAVSAVVQDPAGPVWVSTDRGLARFVNGRFHVYRTSDGLCDARLFTLVDDGRGSLWTTSNKGVFQVSKRELDEQAAGTRGSVTCTRYGRSDGMVSGEGNGGFQPSAWKGRDGRLWFATVKGVAVVDPARLRASPAVALPVSIEEANVDGHPVALAGSARLPPGTKRLEITYTAPSFVAPEKVRFRYRLSGFDRDWVDAGSRRTASYTRLPAGDYQFHVMACNEDGVWNEEGARWSFGVEPFFHETPWFYLAAAGLVAAVAWGGHNLRVRGLRLRNALLVERAHLSQEIHDRISQIMTGVILQLDAAMETLPQGPQVCEPYLARASRLAREAIDEARRILRGLRDPALDQGDLASAVLASTASILDGTQVALSVREEGQPFPLSGDLRNELLHIAREAVTNALRHGRASRIDVVIAFSCRGVGLTVEDDGRGFVPPAPGGPVGLGLPGIARRVSDHRGTLDIRGRPGGGTTLTAFVPR